MKLPDGVPAKVKRRVLTPDTCREVERRFWTAARRVFDPGYNRYTGTPDLKDILPPKLAAVPHFVAAYVADDAPVLLPHNDGHEGCTMSLVIGATGAPAESWPLIVDGKPTGLAVGDGLLYRAKLDHWRDPMPEGLERYVVLMFAFLPERLDGGPGEVRPPVGDTALTGGPVGVVPD